MSCPGVRAHAVQHENPGIVEINRQHKTVDVDTLRRPLGQLVEIAKTGPGHFDTVYWISANFTGRRSAALTLTASSTRCVSYASSKSDSGIVGFSPPRAIMMSAA